MSSPAKNTNVYQTYFFESGIGPVVHPSGSCLQNLIWFLAANESFTLNFQTKRVGHVNNSNQTNITLKLYKLNPDGTRTQLFTNGYIVPDTGVWSNVIQVGSAAISQYETPILVEFSDQLGCWEFKVWLS